MAAAAAAFEIKVEKISRMGRVVVSWESTEMVAGRRSSSLTGECCSTCETVCTVLTQRHRIGATLYFFSYSTAISVVTSCDALGFLAYPPPIGVAQIDATMTETYQDIRVTVGHEFGSKEYHTKRVKFACRGLSVLAPAIRNSSLCCGVTRQLLMASRRVQLWSAVKFGSGKISAVGGSLIVWSFPVLCLCSATVMSIFLWTMLFGFLPKRSGRFASACCLSWHVWSRVWVLLKLHCGLSIAVRCRVPLKRLDQLLVCEEKMSLGSWIRRC